MYGITDSSTQATQPMSWGLSLLYFGLPAIGMIVAFYVFMPFLIRWGMYPYYAYMIGLGMPLLFLLIAALVAYRVEGHVMQWQRLMQRFRYHRMTGRDWIWTAGVFAAEMLIYNLFTRFSHWLIDTGLMPMPASLPPFVDPRTVFTPDTLDAAVGGLRGNWLALAVSVVLLIVNVVGEEFWWRGIVFPRQELAFGRCVWLIHGVLWTLFHSYKWWDLINLLPLSLGLSWVVFHRQNSTPALVIHFITNGAGVVPIFLRVIGAA